MLAFSNNTQVAGQGVYLVSFLAEQEAERIVSYAAAHGKRRFAALIPDDAYGAVVEAAFRRSVQNNGGTVAIVERYPLAANGMLGPAKRVVEAIKGGETAMAPIDALFLPGGQEALPQIGPVIAYAGPRHHEGEAAGHQRLGLPIDRPRRGVRRRLVPELRPDRLALVLRTLRAHLRQQRRRASLPSPTTPWALPSACRPTLPARATRRPT